MSYVLICYQKSSQGQEIVRLSYISANVPSIPENAVLYTHKTIIVYTTDHRNYIPYNRNLLLGICEILELPKILYCTRIFTRKLTPAKILNSNNNSIEIIVLNGNSIKKRELGKDNVVYTHEQEITTN